MAKIHNLEENAMKTLISILTLTALLLANSFSALAQTTLLISIPMLAGHSALNTDLIISLELSDGATWMYVEENQNLEDWMLVDLSQEIKETWDFLKVDLEAPIKLEDWMICKEPWCKKKNVSGSVSTF